MAEITQNEGGGISAPLPPSPTPQAAPQPNFEPEPIQPDQAFKEEEEKPEPPKRGSNIRKVGTGDVRQLTRLVKKVRAEGGRITDETGKEVDFFTVLDEAWDVAEPELLEWFSTLNGCAPSEMRENIGVIGRTMNELMEDEDFNAFLFPIIRLLRPFLARQMQSTSPSTASSPDTDGQMAS